MFCLWDDKSPPKDFKELNYIYWNKSFSSQNSSFSISDILEKNSDKFKSNYLEFVLKLGLSKNKDESVIDILELKPGFSYWWMTLIAEKSNWAKSPQINNILKLMVLEDWLNNNECSTLFINTSDFELFKSLGQLCQSKGIKLIDLKKKNFIFSQIKVIFRNKFFYLLYSFIWLSREIFFSLPFALTKTFPAKNLYPKITFITYLTEKEKKMNMSYWGPLPEYIDKNKVQSNWIYLPNRKIGFIKNFLFFKKTNMQSYNHNNYISISSFFSLEVLKQIIKNFWIIFSSSKYIVSSIKVESSFYWDLIKNDLMKSLYGKEMMNELFYFSLFERMSKELPKTDNLIYLYENQPWELALSYFFNKKTKNIYGFAHSTIRYWDFRYYNSPNIFKKNSELLYPFFSKLIVHGKNDLQNMSKFGFPNDKIKLAESLRYIYLKKYLSLSTKQRDKNTFLVFGDYLRSDTKFIIDLLTTEKVKKALEYYKIIFKPHPHCLVKLKEFNGLNVEIDFSNPGKLINKFDLVLTGNVSSVASEVITLGKKLICAKDLSRLDMSPLRGIKEISFAYDADSFLDEFRKKISDNENRYQDNIFNLDTNLSSWRSILNI
jgi:surface carbohydrate biosynthesis protein (TIGR04326 family)